MMNKTKYIMLLIILPMLFTACTDDSADNPLFGASDIPAIYSSVAWIDGVTVKYGENLTIETQISPADGATYAWSIDGEVVSTEKNIDKLMDVPGIYNLHYKVTRNGVENTRTTQLVVYKDFVPKAYTKKSVGYLTVNGSISAVPWNSITHLIVSSAVVSDNGVPNTAAVASAINLKNLIIIAHNYGVPVLLEYSGTISYMNAASSYQANSFYTAAATPDTRSATIGNMIDYVKSAGFDGINVYMDKATDGAYPNPAALKTFYEGLANAVPDKTANNTDFFLTMSVVGGWTNASLAGVVTIPRYDWINVLAFGAEDTTPSPQSAVSYFTGQIDQWLNWYGVAPSRIVGIVPAFGLRYFGNPALYTWGNLWTFTEYMPYSTLCRTYPDAPTKNVIAVDNGIYYDGFPAIHDKAAYSKTKSLAGMGIWSVENDSNDPTKSLTKEMNSQLEN